MIENYNEINKVKITDSGYLFLHKDISNQLADNFVVQNVGFFSKDKKFWLRIYKKEFFYTLSYVDMLYKSNQFVKKNNDMLRYLMHSVQGYEKITSRGIKLSNKMLSNYIKGTLLNIIQYNNYIDIKEVSL